MGATCAATRGPDAHVRVVFQWLEANHGAEALAAARAGLEDAGPDPRLRFSEGLSLQALRRWQESAEALGAVRSTDGEIACFGGRLPFYSFTAARGLRYAKGDVIQG